MDNKRALPSAIHTLATAANLSIVLTRRQALILKAMANEADAKQEKLAEGFTYYGLGSVENTEIDAIWNGLTTALGPEPLPEVERETDWTDDANERADYDDAATSDTREPL